MLYNYKSLKASIGNMFDEEALDSKPVSTVKVEMLGVDCSDLTRLTFLSSWFKLFTQQRLTSDFFSFSSHNFEIETDDGKSVRCYDLGHAFFSQNVLFQEQSPGLLFGVEILTNSDDRQFINSFCVVKIRKKKEKPFKLTPQYEVFTPQEAIQASMVIDKCLQRLPKTESPIATAEFWGTAIPIDPEEGADGAQRSTKNKNTHHTS